MIIAFYGLHRAEGIMTENCIFNEKSSIYEGFI